ncbi:hypothetical protein PFLUV_G00209320 [Perca fluviatilis]|uniref:Uncharacterized protein n=1 Tax=Perca fluviatilis TaxID=8168 RepID=A0A6A5EJU7_PERFL|nr:hypothetical protein PFLUV_G00209320 [Perca fluviatilis]
MEGLLSSKMPGQGTTLRKCVVCHTEINVACKTCKACKAKQPQKLRLKKKLEKFDEKRESWVHTHQKNRTTSHIVDEASMLALGVRAVIVLSKPGRKENVWVSEVLAPRCQLTDTSKKCLERIKTLYELVIQGWTPQVAAGHSSSPVEPQTTPQLATPTTQPHPPAAPPTPPKSLILSVASTGPSQVFQEKGDSVEGGCPAPSRVVSRKRKGPKNEAGRGEPCKLWYV